jgi:peptidoglycan/LPS O-acetylase OafA/YrhL
LPQFFLLQSWPPAALSDGSLVSNWNMQSWTLSVELFCYISFPWTLRWFERRSTRSIIWWTVGICVVMLALRLPGFDEAQHALFAWQTWLPFPLIRWPEFVYGVLLALLYRRGVAPKSPLALHLLVALVLVLLFTVHNLWLYGPLAVMSGIIVLLLTTSSNASPLNGILTHPVAVMLGRASYSLYILQLPIYLILHAAFPTGWFAKLAYVPLMIGLSIIVFFAYEEPMHRWLRGAKPKKMAAPLT